ncbi:MAG: purine-nucleoside phosphorylase [Verrucomicrobiaceae bacterium]|nr:purine-nucleoside phosphorylase [Verrucomicrobiaceae bacterium]
MATPHLDAQPGEFAPTVLMPGDPLRAQHIAETYLEDVRQVNDVRHMLGFTGVYEGEPVSVMGSGMGIPSISIYAKELFTDFGVKNIVRVGSCGAIHEDLRLRDVVIGMGACTDSGVNRARFQGHDYSAIADYNLLSAMVATAQDREVPIRVGNLFSADLFYSPDTEVFATMNKMGVLAVEMEAAGLYGVAAEYGRRALAVCAVSDIIVSSESLSPVDRQTTFDSMITLALGSVQRFPKD